MSKFEPPPYIGKLIEAVNDGARAAQLTSLTMVTIGVLLVGVSLAITDEDLLVSRPIPLVALGSVTAPPLMIFGFMPVVFVTIHLYTLIRFRMLAADIAQLMSDLGVWNLTMEDRGRCLRLLANVEFVHLWTELPATSAVYRWTAWGIVGAFPVTVLILVQLSSLRAQDDFVNFLCHLSILLELCMLAWFVVHVRQPATQDVTNSFWRLFRPAISSRIGRNWKILGLLCTIFLLDLLYLRTPTEMAQEVQRDISQHKINIPPLSESTKTGWFQAAIEWLRNPYPHPVDSILCRDRNLVCRYLIVRDKALVGPVWDNKVLMELRAGDGPGERRKSGIQPVVLEGRSLLFADLTRTHLPGAYLPGANLYGAILVDTSFDGATLIGSSLHRTVPDGTSFRQAMLNETNFHSVHVNRAIFHGASLQRALFWDAILTEADFQDADLTSADLRGADFARANMRGAGFSGACLAAASLQATKLQGAVMHDTTLLGTKMTEANLDGANLTKANLDSADFSRASLRGASLRQARLLDVHAEAEQKPDLGLADATGIRFDREKKDQMRANEDPKAQPGKPDCSLDKLLEESSEKVKATLRDATQHDRPAGRFFWFLTTRGPMLVDKPTDAWQSAAQPNQVSADPKMRAERFASYIVNEIWRSSAQPNQITADARMVAERLASYLVNEIAPISDRARKNVIARVYDVDLACSPLGKALPKLLRDALFDAHRNGLRSPDRDPLEIGTMPRKVTLTVDEIEDLQRRTDPTGQCGD